MTGSSFSERERDYTSVGGDTLFGLAARYYGDAAKYTWITGANPSLRVGLKPDGQIPIGASITIPGM